MQMSTSPGRLPVEMNRNTVYVISELWLDPNKIDEFKELRGQQIALFEKFSVEYVFSAHPYSWVYGNNEESVPTGISIMKLNSEVDAKRALEEMEKVGIAESLGNRWPVVRTPRNPPRS